MNKQLITSAILALTISGFSQTLKEIIIKTEDENFDAAAKDFRMLLQREPNKGENYFYFGENFFKHGETDSAEYFYSKGIEKNPSNALNYVGLGKIFLSKTKPEDAKAQFYKANTIAANKNAEVYRKLAEAWLTTNIKDANEAAKNASLAIKLDPKNPENYIALGDAEYEKNTADGSIAIKQYHKATELDAKSAKGILREGKIYQHARNYNLAIELYNKALGVEPNFAPAYRELAEIYFMAQLPAKSISNWKKYLELNNSEYAHYRFMSALFSNKQYADAVSEYENLKKTKFRSLFMERLAAYSYAEVGDKIDKETYNKGLNALTDFFNMAGALPNFKYIALDYKYKGILLMRTGKDSLAIIELEKAITMDEKLSGEIYSEIANTSYKSKKYERAILYFDKKFKLDSKSMNNNDWFSFGRSYYYFAGGKQPEIATIKDETQKKIKEEEIKQIYIKADSAFSQFCRLNPTWPVAYIWRGRTNALIDTKIEKDDTKLFYEKVLNSIKPEEKNTIYKKEAIEAYEYLGYYYVSKKDKINSDLMFNNLKELDLNNQKQKDYFNPPKPVAPKTPTKATGKK